MRKIWQPYILHPVAVATILAEIEMTTTTLVAALLHDTVEDTDYTLEELTPTSVNPSRIWSTASPARQGPLWNCCSVRDAAKMLVP